MSEDQRRFTRISFKMKTEIKVNDETLSTNDISNLSVGGCFLPVQTDVESGSPCEIKIVLEGTTDEMAIRIQGEVVRSTSEGLAINFTKIDPESLYHLQNIVKYNSPDADVIESEIDKHPGIR